MVGGYNSRANVTGACAFLDFVYVEDMTFPLTFKIVSEIEGVLNHTSAEVSITQNPNI